MDDPATPWTQREEQAEPVVLWSAATEDDALALVGPLRQSHDERTLLVADTVPMGYRGGIALLVHNDLGPAVTRLWDRDEFIEPDEAYFTPDDRVLLLACGDGVARWSCWSPDDGRCVWWSDAPYRARMLGERTKDNAATVDEELEALEELIADQGPVVGAIDDGGRYVAGSSCPISDSAILTEPVLSRLVYLWDTTRQGPEPPWVLEAEEPVDALAFGAGGRSLAVATRSGAVELWDVDKGHRISRAPSPKAGTPSVIRATPGPGESERFVLALEDGHVLERSSRDLRVLGRAQPGGRVRDLVMRPDGSIVTLSWTSRWILAHDHGDRVVHRWDAPPDHERFGTCALAPGGEAVLVGLPDAVMRYTMTLT